MLTIQIEEKDPTLLTVSFPTDSLGNNLIREVPGRRWSFSRRCWVVPNTRETVVQIGKLFGKEYCRFDEAVVRLYKPTATAQEVEQATNPPWPPCVKGLPARTDYRSAILRQGGSMTAIRLSWRCPTHCASKTIAIKRLKTTNRHSLR
jgi:integrase/recombinase XerD